MTPEPVDVIGQALLRDIPPHQLTQIMIDEAWSDARAAIDAIKAAGWVVVREDQTAEAFQRKWFHKDDYGSGQATSQWQSPMSRFTPHGEPPETD